MLSGVVTLAMPDWISAVASGISALLALMTLAQQAYKKTFR
jgi:hypothetical protein